MKMMTVKATLHPVPREDNTRRFIRIEDGAVLVPESAYYVRRILDGELEQVEPAAEAKEK